MSDEIIENAYKKYQVMIDVCLENLTDDERLAERNRIVCDLLELEKCSGFGAGEYFMYDFAHKTRAEQSAFLTDKCTYDMFKRLNNPKSLNYNTRDKWKVYQHLKPYYHRDICFVSGLEHKEAFLNLLKDKHRLFCKPLCGTWGDQTRIIREKDCESDEDFQKILDYYAPEGFIAEELIKQSEFMMRLNPTSVNTLRIMTIRMDDRICMYFEFKIGEMFSIVDNLGKRSLICGIDESDGTIISSFNKNRTEFKTHPHTHAQVIGAKIPCFSRAVELAKNLARRFPGYRYLSWDLALTDEGWIVVELNGKGGICGFQEVYNCGIRRDIETYLSELNESIEFEGLINESYTSLSEGAFCPHAEYSFSL